jgi:hypothetical protein
MCRRRIVFNPPKNDKELDQLPVAMPHVEHAAPKSHRLTKVKNRRLRDLVDAPFVWFPRREAPAFYDRRMHECYRGGLKSPRIVQEAANGARCPKQVVILSVAIYTALPVSGLQPAFEAFPIS